MLPLRTILHPTDFSERSDYAYRLACALARDYGCRLVVLHVAAPQVAVYGDMILAPSYGPSYKDLKDKLAAMTPKPAARVEHRLEEGDPAAEILRVAKECRCDAIIMGTHGRRGLSRLVMGSVAEQVVRQAGCPVVTVKTPMDGDVPGPVVTEKETAIA